MYWGSENSNLVMQTELNAPGVCVWAGIFAGGVIGPLFFEKTVNAVNYHDMLHDKLIWQQDGAPPLYGNNEGDFLYETFTEWIGRRGTTEDLRVRPDITPIDIWGIVKDKVYSETPRNLQHLRERIESVFEELSIKGITDTICASVFKRCYMCIENNGGHFEHLI